MLDTTLNGRLWRLHQLDIGCFMREPFLLVLLDLPINVPLQHWTSLQLPIERSPTRFVVASGISRARLSSAGSGMANDETAVFPAHTAPASNPAAPDWQSEDLGTSVRLHSVSRIRIRSSPSSTERRSVRWVHPQVTPLARTAVGYPNRCLATRSESSAQVPQKDVCSASSHPRIEHSLNTISTQRNSFS